MPKERKPFVDFKAIRERLTMEQILEHYGVLHTLKRTGTRLTGPCPIHGGKNPTQFRVETEKNLWNCFSECAHGGNTLDFIVKKDKCSLHEAALKACEWFDIPLDDVKNSSPQDEPEETPERPTKPATKAVASKPEDNTPNAPLKFRLDKIQHEHPYLIERGITLETAIDFGIGYFTGDKGLMVGRVVIPIHNVKGELVAYAGRWPGEPPADTEKYKLPPKFKKMQELFNLDRAIKEPPDQPLVIVEGYFSVFKLHQHGCRKVVALMGSSLSDAQVKLIREHTSSQSQVIVMLDEDNAGRTGRADIAARLAEFCFVKTQVFEKEGTQPEYLTAEEVRDLLSL